MPLLLPLSNEKMIGTPSALLSLGVPIRSATLLSATLEPIVKDIQMSTTDFKSHHNAPEALANTLKFKHYLQIQLNNTKRVWQRIMYLPLIHKTM